MTWASLALSIIRLIVLITERWQRNSWMNEGARLALAQQLKEQTDDLAKALGVEKEVLQLAEAEVLAKAEAKGWLRD